MIQRKGIGGNLACLFPKIVLDQLIKNKLHDMYLLMVEEIYVPLDKKN